MTVLPNTTPDLAQAQRLATTAQFNDFLDVCDQLIQCHADDANALLNVGVLLSSFGFLSAARAVFERVCTIAPNDLRPLVNLAGVLREAGEHAASHRLYAALLAQLPNHAVIRRNALVSLEYDPDVLDMERRTQAQAWGQWAIAKAGSNQMRPTPRPLATLPLRVGYVSADFCQHTVGLFIKDVLAAHDPVRVTVFAYSAGSVNDWVTDVIRSVSDFRDVATFDDTALAAQIRQDEIDVLVDLSGHTAGSRLTVFAHRPAPVQVSWLGYFATTGLEVIDAVLLDEWHAPLETQAQFVEPIVHLPGGRFCYVPVPFAPEEVAPPPSIANGYVTFGCFNNTAKLNTRVFEAWAQIMMALPDSRLVLKWRTFQDAVLCQSVRDQFARLGITSDRIEFRGASFHADLLKEYADIDIALDPFAFTGGLTSCEALWMGVPVVTWPQSRVVSRQTYALLSTIGLPELAGQSCDDYVRIAINLAGDFDRLKTLRSGLRKRMNASSLCDVARFTRGLEDTLLRLATKFAAEGKQ